MPGVGRFRQGLLVAALRARRGRTGALRGRDSIQRNLAIPGHPFDISGDGFSSHPLRLPGSARLGTGIAPPPCQSLSQPNIRDDLAHPLGGLEVLHGCPGPLKTIGEGPRRLAAAIVSGRGVQPVRQVAIDETWSALRFRPALPGDAGQDRGDDPGDGGRVRRRAVGVGEHSRGIRA